MQKKKKKEAYTIAPFLVENLQLHLDMLVNAAAIYFFYTQIQKKGDLFF